MLSSGALQVLHMGKEEFSFGRDVELLIEAEPVILDGAPTHAEALGNAGNRMAFERQQDDFSLAVCEWREPGIAGCAGARQSGHLDLFARTSGSGTKIGSQAGPDE